METNKGKRHPETPWLPALWVLLLLGLAPRVFAATADSISVRMGFINDRLLDDFEDGDIRSAWGQLAGIGNNNGSGSLTGSLENAPSIAFGRTGNSLKMAYDVTPASSYAFYVYTDMNQNLSDRDCLSFRVKGSAGGETFRVQVRGNNVTHEVPVNNWLPQGITSGWQRVVIPFRAFSTITDFTDTDVFGVVFNNNLGAPQAGTVYLDDISFGTAPATVWVDNFNDNTASTAEEQGYLNIVQGGSPAGCASLTPAFDAAERVGGSGYGLRVVYSTAACSSFTGLYVSLLMFPMAPAGLFIPVQQADSIELALKAGTNGLNKNIGVGVRDKDGDKAILMATLTANWSLYQIPLSSFTQQTAILTLSQARTVDIFFQNSEAGHPVFNNTEGFILYVDNLRFIASTPTAPSGLLDDGSAVTNGYNFGANSINVLSATAQSKTAKPTMDGVRFEYSTDGVTWTSIGTDYDTNDATYRVRWATDALPPGGNYRIRAVAQDSAGQEAAMAPVTNLVINQ